VPCPQSLLIGQRGWFPRSGTCGRNDASFTRGYAASPIEQGFRMRSPGARTIAGSSGPPKMHEQGHRNCTLIAPPVLCC